MNRPVSESGIRKYYYHLEMSPDLAGTSERAAMTMVTARAESASEPRRSGAVARRPHPHGVVLLEICSIPQIRRYIWRFVTWNLVANPVGKGQKVEQPWSRGARETCTN
jgi:hypothetical protein